MNKMIKTYRVLNIISSLIGEVYESEGRYSSGLMEFLEELEGEVTESIDNNTPLTDFYILDTLHTITGISYWIGHKEDNLLLEELFNKLNTVLNEQ